MGNNIFLSKLSFSFFTWLVIFFGAVLNFGHIDKMHISMSQIEQYFHIPTQAELYKSVEQLIPTANAMSRPTLIQDIPKNDLQCMAENIYYEAGNQSYVGKLAVGQVVLNRVKMPGYPDSICKVIDEGHQSLHTSTCQFTWRCETHSPIQSDSAYWVQSMKAAKELLSKKGSIVDITEGATNYHADYISPPWSKTLHFVTKIDNHLFYRPK